MEDEKPKKKPVHDVGMLLDALSIDELGERIGVLEEEIQRLRDAIEAKSASRSVAESIFKI